MKVILLADIKGTGKKGDVKDVADGYARNFLIPEQLVKVATTLTVEQLKAEQMRKKKESEAELKENQKSAAMIDGREIELHEKVNKEGRLYAAVSGKKIADEIKKQLKAAVSPPQIQIAAPIKENGEYTVRVLFPHGLEAELKVIVIAA